MPRAARRLVAALRCEPPATLGGEEAPPDAAALSPRAEETDRLAKEREVDPVFLEIPKRGDRVAGRVDAHEAAVRLDETPARAAVVVLPMGLRKRREELV